MKTSSLIASAVATVVAAALLANADPAPEPAFKAEKCYGIAAAARTIAAPPAFVRRRGQRANDPKSWIYVPVGTCSKIQGGSLETQDIAPRGFLPTKTGSSPPRPIFFRRLATETRAALHQHFATGTTPR